MSAIIRRRGLIGADDGKLWLYKYGDECTDVTGGWQGQNINGASAYKTTGGLWLYSRNKAQGRALFTTNNAIDLSLYSSVHFDVYSLETTSTYQYVCVGTTKPSGAMPSTNEIINKVITSASEIVVDTSSIQRNGFIYFRNYTAGEVSFSVVAITRIWLEK